MAGQMGGSQDNSNVELDLAPLLSIIMKLVPALILSAVFLQVTMIETDIPQAVKEAIENPDQKPTASIKLEISGKTGLKLTVVDTAGQQKVADLPLKENQFDLSSLHAKMQEVKRQHPEVFRVEFEPEGDVPFQEIVRLMDEVRKSHDKKITYPVFDKKQNKQIQTDYMFPDVVFSNVFEG